MGKNSFKKRLTNNQSKNRDVLDKVRQRSVSNYKSKEEWKNN